MSVSGRAEKERAVERKNREIRKIRQIQVRQNRNEILSSLFNETQYLIKINHRIKEAQIGAVARKIKDIKLISSLGIKSAFKGDIYMRHNKKLTSQNYRVKCSRQGW